MTIKISAIDDIGRAADSALDDMKSVVDLIDWSDADPAALCDLYNAIARTGFISGVVHGVKEYDEGLW